MIMSKPSTRKRLAALVAIGAVTLGAFGAWRWLGAREPASEDPSLLLDRAWIESKPQKYTDYVQAFFASSRSPIGVFSRASTYDYHFEVARFRRDRDKLALTFPQTEKQAEITFSIRACKDLPPFDLCLDLSANPWGGPKRYYGMREQDDESRELGKAGRLLRAEAEE
jgi:hypothetical protein